jgi:hypothetical protein
MTSTHYPCWPTCLASILAGVLFFAGSSSVGLAADHCGKDQVGPLPDCFEVKYRGGGKIRLRNYCEYDVEVKLDHSGGEDDFIVVKAGHEKNFVSRLAVNLYCCQETTPQCPREEPGT